MEHPLGTDKRFTVVYVGGIGHCKGKEVVECKDEIKKLYMTHVDQGAGNNVEVTMHKTKNNMAYALIDCMTEDLAFKAINKLNNKHILKGKVISVSFFYAERDSITSYTIGERKEYRTKLINRLRNKLCKKSPMDIWCSYTGRQKDRKPVLPEHQGGKQPWRWIEIKLMIKEGDIITSTTTLVIRDDNLYVKGFRNKYGKWFELLDPKETEEEKLPAEDYMAELVGWGATYSSIMGVQDDEQVKRTFKTARLGRAFAERAVRRLSNYPDNEYNDDYMPVRLGLAGLIVMICEAARMDAFLDHFADHQLGAWDRGVGLKEKLLDYMWNWKNMSAALLKTMDNPYRPWDDTAREAFDCVHLVLNSTEKIKGSDGSAQVEILDVSVNFRVVDIKFINEAQLPCKIYTQPELQTHRLELTVPGSKCISGHKWFGMEVATLASTGTGDCSIGKEFKCDCRKQAGGDATEFVVRKIDLDSSQQVEVTYLAMSNAIEAKVEVKLELDPALLPHEHDGGGGLGNNKQYTAQGDLIAHIGGFERYPIVLFRRVDEPITLGSPLILELDRSAIHVPQGKELQIDLNGLHITETSCDDGSKREVKKPAGRLSFCFGCSSPTPQVGNNDGEVQMNVNWKTKATIEPTAQVCPMTIGSKDEFTRSIDDLSRMLTDDNEPLFNGIKRLTRKRAKQPQRWIHVELKVKEAGEEKWSTTVAIQDGKCYGVGFLNQSKVWYELGNGSSLGTLPLPPEYNSVLLGWGLSYDKILGLSTHEWDGVYRELNKEGLGKKSFAEKAVRTLWRYPDVDDKEDMKPRVALAGLIIMVCQSARFNPVRRYFQDNWDKDNVAETDGFSKEQMKYIWSWGKISRSLLLWIDNGEWPDDDQTAILKQRGIQNKDDALAAVRLVYSDARTLQFQPTPTGGSMTEDLPLCYSE